MTEYTPSIEAARKAYVRGMEDTFTVVGEHEAEFDRWLAQVDIDHERIGASMLAVIAMLARAGHKPIEVEQ